MNPQKNIPSSNKQSPKLSNNDYEKLVSAVRNYEDRIKEIEGSMYWRTYQFFTKTKLILTSDSYLKSDKWRFFQRIRFLFSGPGLRLIKKFILQFFGLFFGKIAKIFKVKPSTIESPYHLYMENHFPRQSDLEEMRNTIPHFKQKPSIDILAFVNSSNFKYLNLFLNALESQVYEKVSVSFITDEPNDKIAYTLNKVSRNDEVYKIIEYQNLEEHLQSSNKSLFLLADISCIPRKDATYQMLQALNKAPFLEYMYFDNDFVSRDNQENHFKPYFKPGFSPHTLLSRNYIGEMVLVNGKLIKSIELPKRPNFYALNLTLSNAAKYVKRIPRILYHKIEEDLNIALIEENHHFLNTFLAQKMPGASAVLSSESAGCFEPNFPIPKEEPLISIIIPCKNKAEVLDVCLNSIFENSSYTNFEIIIIDNGSTEKSFFSTVALWEYNYPTRVRCYNIDIPFNYSKLNNEAVKYSKGDFLLFLNNDTEVISSSWMEDMLQYAQLKEVGMVGAKLLYPNNTLQHAGIVLNIDDTGAHVYSGAYKNTAGYFNNANCLTNYSAVTGACMLIAKNKFELVGGFDESLAVDCNDVELCCKLLEQGLYNIYNPNVKLIHYECLTRGNPALSKRSMVRQQKEKGYFIGKWNQYVKKDPFYNPNLSQNSKNFELNISE